MNLRLLSCEIFFRELCTLAARSPHRVDLEFLPKGLHDLPAGEMLARVQAAVDAAPARDYAAQLLGYGLCNNGLVGLTARAVPLVVPRAHDCITLFFGSKERYQEYFFSHPGVYFQTSGWLERGEERGAELRQQTIPHKLGMDKTLAQYIAEYGEDNGPFLYEQLAATTRNYGQFTFIEMGIEPDARFERQTEAEAAARGWRYEKLRGDLRLLEQLLSGDWPAEDFLVLAPGQTLRATHDAGIIGV